MQKRGWGSYLRDSRNREGLALRLVDVAEAVGVSTATVSNWERELNQSPPNIFEAAALAAVLQVPFAQLLEAFGIPMAPRGAEKLDRDLVRDLVTLHDAGLLGPVRETVRGQLAILQLREQTAGQP